jgi:hypothetical protein
MSHDRRRNKNVAPATVVARYEGLGGSLVKKGLLTEEEYKGFLDKADGDYNMALSLLIRFVNTRMADRGKKGAR